MADKTASVKLTADPKGFISGLKQVENAAKSTGAKIETSLSKAAKNSAAEFMKSARVMANVGARGADGRFLNAGLSQLKDMAKTVKDAYRDAYREAVRLEQLKSTRAKELAKATADSRKESLGTLKTVGGYAAAGAVALGTKAVVDANKVLDKATRLSISSRGAGQEGADPNQLMAEFFAITQDIKGVTADQLADGAARFVQMTGDLKTARSSLKDFAIVAAASGANVEDVAGTAAAISQQFGITDPGQIRDVLSALVFQGKSGAFELRDAAALFPRLAAAGSSFGLDKGAGGVKTLGGLTQIAMSATGSGDRAATAVTALLSKLTTESAKLAAKGAGERVDVFDKKGNARDLPTVLAEIIARTGGNDMAKKKAGLVGTFDQEAYAGIAGLVGQYGGMLANATGKTDAERQANAQEQLRQKIMESVNAAGSWSEVVKDAAAASGTSSAKMTATWEGFTASVSTKVLPKIAALGDKAMQAGGAFDALVSVLGAIASVAGFVGEQFNYVANLFGGDGQAIANKSALTNDAAREKQRAETLRGELQKIAPGVGDDFGAASVAAAGGDPAKLKQIRDLQERISVAEGMAASLREKASAINVGGKAGSSEAEQAAARKAAGLEDVAPKPGPPVKATLDTGGKVIDVRVTNQPGPSNKPTPGYHTPVP